MEDEVVIDEIMKSNHEEAYTKLISLVKAANLRNGDSVRSPSGDIDVLSLFVALDFAGIQVWIDNETGLNKKIVNVASSTLGH